MASAEASIEIGRPAEDVFPWLVEPDRRVQWVEGLTASEQVGDDRYRETMEAGGRRVEVTATVTRLDRPHAVELELSGSGITAQAASRVAEAGGGCRVTSSLDLQLGGLLRFAGGMAARQAQGSLERSLARLKQLVEAQPAPSE